MKVYINYYLFGKNGTLEKKSTGHSIQDQVENSKKLGNFQIQKSLFGQPDPDLKFGHK